MLSKKTKWDSGVHWLVVLVLVVLVSVVGFRSWGQTSSAWDRNEVASYLDQNPTKAAEFLEQVLAVDQQDALWALMFPAPTDGDLEKGYEQVRLELRRLQLEDTDAVVQEVERRLDGLKAVER